jgi:copper transport protein
MSATGLADLLLAVSRFVWYGGIVGVIGASAFRLFAPPVPAEWARAASNAGLIAAVLLAAGMLVRLYAQTYASFGLEEPVTIDLLLIVATALPPWSTGWMLQAGAAVAAVAAFAAARSGRGSGWIRVHAAALAVAATTPLTGHAVAQPGGSVLPVSLQALHVLGAGIWIGGLLTVFIAALRRRSSPSAGSLPLLVNAFSPCALLGAGLLAASGGATTALYLNEVSDLWTTGYGRTLVAKLVAVAAVAGGGFVNWRRVRPRLSDPQAAALLRRSAALELAFAAAALALTAVLVGLPQPGE